MIIHVHILISSLMNNSYYDVTIPLTVADDIIFLFCETHDLDLLCFHRAG